MLETARLLLLSTDQVTPQAMADYQRRNRDFLTPYESLHTPDYYTVDYWRDTLAEYRAEEAESRACRYFIFPKQEPALLIGYISLTAIVRGAFHSCFMGYKLDEGHINQGYMSEAVSVVTRDAFTRLRLHRIEANIMPWNKRSQRVAEKCGFTCEGLSPRYLLINGKWEDHLHWVLLNEEME